MEPIWIGSPVDVRRDKEAIKALNIENDAAYWDDKTGIIMVDENRWLKAQEYERATWMQHATTASSDRDHEHAELFDNYMCLPPDLGNILEIGCGPFTQTRTILRNHTAESITLLDPLLETYKQHPHCSYYTLEPSPILLPIPAEGLLVQSGYDTIICINVLEHVRDAKAVLNNIKRALRPHGIAIIGERTYDDLDISQLYDVGHPIRVKSTVLDEFRHGMTLLYSNGSYFIARLIASPFANESQDAGSLSSGSDDGVE